MHLILFDLKLQFFLLLKIKIYVIMYQLTSSVKGKKMHICHIEIIPLLSIIPHIEIIYYILKIKSLYIYRRILKIKKL